jgi:hypothetical protein
LQHSASSTSRIITAVGEEGGAPAVFSFYVEALAYANAAAELGFALSFSANANQHQPIRNTLTPSSSSISIVSSSVLAAMSSLQAAAAAGAGASALSTSYYSLANASPMASSMSSISRSSVISTSAGSLSSGSMSASSGSGSGAPGNATSPAAIITERYTLIWQRYLSLMGDRRIAPLIPIPQPLAKTNPVTSSGSSCVPSLLELTNLAASLLIHAYLPPFIKTQAYIDLINGMYHVMHRLCCESVSE